MRSKSNGQGVLTSKHKQQQLQQSTSHTSQVNGMANSEPHYSTSTPSSHQSSNNLVVVDPSLQDAHNQGLSGVNNDNGNTNNYKTHNGADAESSQYLNMSYTPNSFLHAPFNYSTAGTGSPGQDGTSGMGGMVEATPSPTPSMAALRATNDNLAHDTSSPEPDSADASYRTLRLPPILQVEKRLVTTTATQTASAIRRKNDAVFKCPVPGCGSTFTRRFNLRGHLRSHTEERPFVCEWPGCGKGFARSHDCKRHTALHTAKSGSHVCTGCGKTFSRTDALNRHLKSEVGASCRDIVAEAQLHQPPSHQHSGPGIGEDGEGTSSISGSQMDESPLRPLSFAT